MSPSLASWTQWIKTCAVLKCGEPHQSELLAYCGFLLNYRPRPDVAVVQDSYLPRTVREQDVGEDDDEYQQKMERLRNEQLAAVLDNNLRLSLIPENRRKTVEAKNHELAQYKAALGELGDAGAIYWNVCNSVHRVFYHEASRIQNLESQTKRTADGNRSNFRREISHVSLDVPGARSFVNSSPGLVDDGIRTMFDAQDDAYDLAGHQALFLEEWSERSPVEKLCTFLTLLDFEGHRVSWYAPPVADVMAHYNGMPLQKSAAYKKAGEAKRWVHAHLDRLTPELRKTQTFWLCDQLRQWAFAEKHCECLHSLPVKITKK